VPFDDLKDELGPFAVGLGGAVVVAGSIMPWAVVSFQPGPLGVVPSRLFTPVRHVMGTHTVQGKFTLAIGLALSLLGIAALLVRDRRPHLGLGTAAALGAVAILVVGVTEFGRVSADSAVFDPLRYPQGIRGIPFRHIVTVSSSYGLDVLLGGAALALAGSVMVALRARRRRTFGRARHYSSR
jgi:hypothetical protein